MYLVHWVEEALDPKGAFFDPAIFDQKVSKKCNQWLS